MGFARGRPVIIVESPDGTPCVMQAYSLIVDPKRTYADLQTPGTKLKRAPGKYWVKVLEWNLIVRPSTVSVSVARVVHDALENTHDKCFGTACRHNP